MRVVTEITPDGGIVLDRTIFYAARAASRATPAGS